MQWDTWYDLSVRELSDMTDPAAEKLTEAEETAPVVPGNSASDESDAAAPAEG